MATAKNIGIGASPTTFTQTFSTADATHANRTSAALTNSGGGVAADGTIAAITTQLCGYQYLQNIVAKADDNAADQFDVSGGNGTMGNPVDPDVPRNIKIKVVDAAAADIDAFTITVTGKDSIGATITEVFTFGGGLIQTGSKMFTSLTSIVLTDINNQAASDTLDAGWQDKIGIPIPPTASGLTIVKLVVDGTDDTIAATDTTYNSVLPTTLPNAARDFEIWYEYSMVNQLTADAVTELVDQINKTRADLADTAGVLNSAVDALQDVGVVL